MIPMITRNRMVLPAATRNNVGGVCGVGVSGGLNFNLFNQLFSFRWFATGKGRQGIGHA
jgi:hypothetical protein